MAGEDTELPRRGVSRPRASRSASCRRSRGSIPRRRARQRRGGRRRDHARSSTRYDELNAKLGEDLSPDEMEKVLDEQATHPGPDRRRRTPGISIRGSSWRWTRCGCPPADADVATLSGGERRRVALCRLLLQSPGPAAARRADQPPRRRVGRLARALPARTTRARSSRSRTIATSSTTSPAGFSSSIAAAASPGRATTRRGSSRSSSRLALEEKAETQAAAHARARARVDPHVAARAPGEGQGAAQRVRGSAAPRIPPQKIETAEIYIAPGPRLGDVVVEARRLRKGYGDNLLIEDLDFTLPRGGIVGVIGPNGAGKTTLFRMIIGQEQPDAGTLQIGETVTDRLRRSEPRRARAEQDRLGGDLRRRRRDRARQAQGGVARLRVVVQLQGRAPSSGRSARCPAASATACTWPSCCRRAATCCCSTSRPTISTSTRCARSKRRC